MNLSFVVLGEPASKANSRKLVMFGRGPKARPGIIKSDKARAYVKTFQKQCPKLTHLLLGDLAVTVRIYYTTRRPDLDASVIFDAMEGMVYANDRQIREMHLYGGVDAAKPRAEIIIQPIQGSLGFAIT